MSAWRWLLALAAVAIAAVLGWRIVATHQAAYYATSDPARALAWQPHDPEALLAQAQDDLQAGKPQAAARLAREALARSPLAGDAYAILGQAAANEGDRARARTLFAIALHRAPRNLTARAWIASDELQRGQYAAALRNIDVLLRIAPGAQGRIFPIMVRMTAVPAFTRALATMLGTGPGWAPALLATLLATNNAAAVDQVFGALSDAGTLSAAQRGQWLDWLLRHGRWGEAYARWVGSLHLAAGATLPYVYNGGFAMDGDTGGFDWRLAGNTGVVIERVRDPQAASGWAARVTFLGRRVDDANFWQPLVLQPGNYRLRFAASATDLRSDQGLEWVVSCATGARVLGASPRLQGSFAWQPFASTFTVPATGCPVQRLWLYNPGAAGPGKLVSGELLVSGFVIARTKSSNG